MEIPGQRPNNYIDEVCDAVSYVGENKRGHDCMDKVRQEVERVAWDTQENLKGLVSNLNHLSLPPYSLFIPDSIVPSV